MTDNGGDGQGITSAERSAYRWFLLAHVGEILQGHRTSACAKQIVPGKNAELRQGETSKRVWVGNLSMCKSVWVCPICAFRIAEKRRRLLRDVLSRCGLVPVLVTYTIQHNKREKLGDVLNRLRSAYQRLNSGRGWQWIKNTRGIEGVISALEITHGAAGWHPHIHALVLISGGGYLDIPAADIRSLALDRLQGELYSDLFTRWRQSVTGIGGYVNEAAFDLAIANDRISEYIAKWGKLPEPAGRGWGVSDEVTRAVVKGGKVESRSPWELLAASAGGDESARAHWLEYVVTMEGRRQIQMTAGLPAKLGLDDGWDTEIESDEEQEASYLLATLNAHQWRVILENGARADLLRVAAESKTIAEIWAFLDGLKGMRPDEQTYRDGR